MYVCVVIHKDKDGMLTIEMKHVIVHHNENLVFGEKCLQQLSTAAVFYRCISYFFLLFLGDRVCLSRVPCVLLFGYCVVVPLFIHLGPFTNRLSGYHI